MIAGFVLTHIIAILECLAIVGFCVVAGSKWGGLGVIAVLSVFALLKSFELDLKAKP